MHPAVSLVRVADLSAAERDEVRALSRVVYPPEKWADWPGRLLEWSAPQWCVCIRDHDGALASYAGVVVRDGTVDDVPVRIGGVGGIKTHPAARGRGHARLGIEKALDFFREQPNVAFALLVCEPHLVPYYAALGWTEFHGSLRVLQHREVAEFTFNRVMTHPVRGHGPITGTIDLRGAPW
ncbi:MAG: GNAT family N-acetyltransferase [Thermoanaerobaculia bacterium]